MAIDLTQRIANGLPTALGLREEGHTFALVVRQYRKDQGWTQAVLAEEWNYSFETVSAWERGKRFPARPEIPRVAQLLGVDAQELVELVIRSRMGRGEHGERVRVRSVPEALPFAQGRLLWTLHLGLEHGRLQCVITCPLASGEVWEVPLDSLSDAETIRLVHQVVHEHVSKKAGG
jgi:transcriptional regulator with XRE-family HTH domain